MHVIKTIRNGALPPVAAKVNVPAVQTLMPPKAISKYKLQQLSNKCIVLFVIVLIYDHHVQLSLSNHVLKLTDVLCMITQIS